MHKELSSSGLCEASKPIRLDIQHPTPSAMLPLQGGRGVIFGMLGSPQCHMPYAYAKRMAFGGNLTSSKSELSGCSPRTSGDHCDRSFLPHDPLHAHERTSSSSGVIRCWNRARTVQNAPNAYPSAKPRSVLVILDHMITRIPVFPTRLNAQPGQFACIVVVPLIEY